MAGSGSRQVTGNSSELPSFYSPRTQPEEAAGDDSDIDKDFSLSHPPQPTKSPTFVPTNVNDHAESTTPPDHSTRLGLAPLPSLLSPAFTPPATPGVATPNSYVADVRPPRSVPVDSSKDTGGCGNKRPRLLERLPSVECIVRARIPTTTGAEMFLHLYTNDVDNKEHLAIVFGNNIRSGSLDAVRPGETERDRMIRGAYTGVLYPGRTTSGMTAGGQRLDGNRTPGSQPARTPHQPPLVRIHSECYIGETVWSARCDCGEQLDEAARLMSLPENKAGGIIIYLRQEGRGIGLGEKLKAYNLQDLGSDTVEANLLLRHPADARSYGLATAMLRDLGQTEVRLLTNNPDKIRAVEGPNREVVVTERVAMIPLSWKGRGGFRSKEVEGYLKTKVRSLNVRRAKLCIDVCNHRSRGWATCFRCHKRRNGCSYDDIGPDVTGKADGDAALDLNIVNFASVLLYIRHPIQSRRVHILRHRSAVDRRHVLRTFMRHHCLNSSSPLVAAPK